jgi:hypothetical protein
VLAFQKHQNSRDKTSYHVITSEERVLNFRDILPATVFLEGVPSSFRPSKARSKARKLEWFRISHELTSDDWVLHIDEEGSIDGHAIEMCYDFIERQEAADLGQVRRSRIRSCEEAYFH